MSKTRAAARECERGSPQGGARPTATDASLPGRYAGCVAAVARAGVETIGPRDPSVVQRSVDH